MTTGPTESLARETTKDDPIGALLDSARKGVTDLVTRTLNYAGEDAVAFSGALANAVVVAAASGKPAIVAEVVNQGRLLLEIHRIRVERATREQLLAFAKTAAEIALSAVLMNVKGPIP